MKCEQQNSTKLAIAEIALPVPIRKVFDYQIPDELRHLIVPGIRVVVPFGRQKITGLVVKKKATSNFQTDKLKSIISSIDQQPVINNSLFKLLSWVSNYYQYPLGEVIKVALPNSYQPKASDVKNCYQLVPGLNSERVSKQLYKAPKQKQIFDYMLAAESSIDSEQLKLIDQGWRRALNELMNKQIVEMHQLESTWPSQSINDVDSFPKLSDAQAQVFSRLSETDDKFNVSLLKGVTGSGKTEIYLQLARRALDRGKQVLVLVPEISLTPQLVSRFEHRLGFGAAVLHSALGEKTRRRAWQAAEKGQAKVILGTRSAVFTAIADLGLIILDEEHDMSYKQQEGVRYHARDVAVMRAKLEGIPILLGSATPSLESLANVRRERYQLLELNERIGKAVMPKIHLLSMDQLPVKQGLSTTLINAIEKNLQNNQQSLIFINRRGYAPVVLCKSCGESLSCGRCNVRLTYHNDNSLHCHHCGLQQTDDNVCLSCGSNSLIRLGQGTQRIEATLSRLFPAAKIARLDRDAVRKKDDLETVLENITAKNIDILIGTQMLSKGHDFPDVTLVGVINSDQGLFGLDFHSTESMTQQLIQVSGRAGRAEKPGKVLIQTNFPEHPLYRNVSNHAYMDFANQELRLRQQSGFPPFSYLALIRASATDQQAPIKFLIWIKELARKLLENESKVNIFDPVHSPMAKRKGRYRAQLLISSSSRSARGIFLSSWINAFENDKRTRRVRWSIDVDPLDLY